MKRIVWNINNCFLLYLDEVEILDEVDTDDDVDTELEVETLKLNSRFFGHRIS